MKNLFLLVVFGVFLVSVAEAAEETIVFTEKGDVLAGRRAFVKLGCVGCHQVLGDRTLPKPNKVAPILGGLNEEHSVEELAQAIVSPSHSFAPGFIAPTNGKSPMPELDRTMTVRELIDVVAYLKQSENTTEPWPKEH